MHLPGATQGRQWEQRFPDLCSPMTPPAARADHPATMSRRNFHHVVAALDALVPHATLRRALQDHQLTEPEGPRVDQHRCVGLATRLASHHGDPALLLRGFQRLHADQRLFTGLPGFHGDVLAGLRQFQRYLSLHTELGDMALVIGADTSELRLHRRPAFEHNDGQSQALLFSTRRLLQRGGLADVKEVHLRLRADAGEQKMRRALYDVPVHFDMPSDALVLDNHQLLRVGSTRSTALVTLGLRERHLRQTQPELAVSDSVRALLPMVLGLPGTPLALCASLLAMGERTLQRRVEAEGHGFRDLLQESRRELALTLLPWRHLSTERLAARLGYQQSAQFYRAFRAWFGESPGRHRAAVPT